MPFLLGKDAAYAGKWNVALYQNDFSGEGNFRTISDSARELVEGAKYRPPGMYTRWPCFWWYGLRGKDELDKLFFNCQDEWADVVFCEDISKFEEVGGKDQADDRRAVEDDPKEFEAEFGGPWARRYVRDLKDTQYSPRSRLAI